MKESTEYILSQFLNTIYSFQKTAITQKKITFITASCNEPGTVFSEIQKHLQGRKNKKSKALKLQIVNICDDLSKEEDGFSGKTAMHTLKCMHHMANSRVVVFDSRNDIAIRLLTHKNSLVRIDLSDGLTDKVSFYKDGYRNEMVLEPYEGPADEELQEKAEKIADFIIGEIE